MFANILGCRSMLSIIFVYILHIRKIFTFQNFLFTLKQADRQPQITTTVRNEAIILLDTSGNYMTNELLVMYAKNTSLQDLFKFFKIGFILMYIHAKSYRC